jgi:beta-galactosidase GanA
MTFDKYSLMLDGHRLVLWSGEFHYWRLPSVRRPAEQESFTGAEHDGWYVRSTYRHP